jgi:hypothetical protein
MKTNGITNLIQPSAVYSPYPEYIQNNFSPYEIKEYEIYFAVSMIYVISPLLYIAFITGNIGMINSIWKIIHSGIFDSIQTAKNYLSNKMIFFMRYFGYYTFSTYTVVKNGRELFSSYSEHINVKTTRENIKQTDMAKYRVCKWIDAQCAQYRKLNNNSDPEVSEAKNDIYDFIIHSSLDYNQSRIHRGDLRISTHTQFLTNYRTYQRSFYIENYAELVVPKQTELPDTTATTSSYEIIPICIKFPSTFYIEKNELYDRSFMQWYLLNRICRPDISDYIGSSTATYEVILYHRDFIKYAQCDNCLCIFTKNIKDETLDEIVNEISNEQEDTTKKTDFFMKLTSGQHIMVGSDYIIKVDTALNCPVYEINQKSVVSIDDDINNFCNQSEQSYTDNESDNDDNTDDGVNESDGDDHDDDDEDDISSDESETDKENITSEFEIIESSP